MYGAQSSAINSYLGWWRDAGLSDDAGNTPRDWFGKPEVTRRPETFETAQVSSYLAPVEVPSVAQLPSSPTIIDMTLLPDTLAAFDRWLATTIDLPGQDWSARCLPTGPADAAILLLTDVPDAEDVVAGKLLSGAAGRLLDALLTTIGRKRTDVRIGSIAFTRPVAGRINASEADRLIEIARHHIALVRPRHLVLIGQQTSQLMAAAPQSPVNHDQVTMATMAIHHPRLLLERPLLKRQVWEVLKTIKEPV